MERRQNYSRKREAILKIVQGTKVHPSAEWVYHELKPSYPDLSLGTVYRNLAMFVADGNVVSVGTVAGQERYDADTTPHAHFVCTCCGCVTDVCSPNLAGMDAEVESEVGGVVTSRSLSFFGKCAACLDSADIGA